MSKFKALALGNYTDVKYHPFEKVDREIEGSLEEVAEVTSTGDYSVLNKETLEGYDLFISYTEFSQQPEPQERVAALLDYVANGGGLLVIHNGISLQRNKELMTMMGAKFTGHPEFTTLPVQNTLPDHPIMKGIEPFEIDDEPYRFDMIPHFDTTILAQYEHDNQLWPAAWAHEYGMGRVVYLMNGHQLSCFSVKPFRQLIKQAGLWAAKVW
ncbi:MAG: ThuA domain-containing protein [Candidatus Pristimantibacillus lignocellulolyticus]|uniref:ThuA domain-containing protein n=1 Tax=Candidatus Pristimantibacillus lignocellulolyticus TaxID=2994561 RepID=A0A9J6ZIW8_9BACL|nr:MAG: ThuA domain-containing protein [Candidatus Pristimantibacillus lignocellulolyticus]